MTIQVKKTICSIASPLLESYGFQYDISESKRDRWVYTKTDVEGTRFICFERSNFRKNALGLFLFTTHRPAGIYGSSLINREDIWWRYEDTESLVKCVQEMAELVVETGISWLNRNMVAMKNPPEPIVHLLFTERDSLAEQFLTSNHIPLDKKGITFLENLVEEKRSRSIEPDWDFLIKIFAVYSTIVQNAYGGEWSWSDFLSEPILQGLGGNSHAIFRPVAVVISCWYRTEMKLSHSTNHLDDMTKQG